ncbi:concanavalin A-like lectin/glucanase domain-containing protein [Elsinoe ampelina]|uniref:Concanavalin A-like lectin/glucanase domain-containing protein n=1 Tax=Elsinoe ampelina TaxID=302913 RepID=A0A6A6GIB2_9PEZI|nr:concanavalin A-like lectin/glucanase domain-containing protein [Elsinoe ampelina]
MYTRSVILPLAAICVVIVDKALASNCNCGFSINRRDGTSSPAYFSQVLETDFLHLRSFSTAPDWDKKHGNKDWTVQVFNKTSSQTRGPYGKAATLQNTIKNPIDELDTWSGDGIRGRDPGLQLVTSPLSDSLPAPDGGPPMIKSGEIATVRSDILYGSFRAGLKMTGVNGTCGAFFWYRNDSAEIDIESLSRQLQVDSKNKTVAGLTNIVIQSPQSVAQGFDAAGTPGYQVAALLFDPTEGYHEYRFDWLPGSVAFYADGQHLGTLTSSVPSDPGKILLSHWSNGGAGWSGGPPPEPAVMTVSYVKAYFNSSDAATNQKTDERCAAAKTDVCTVPEWSGSIDPTQTDSQSLSSDSPFLTNPNQTPGSLQTGSASGSYVSAAERVAMAGRSVSLLLLGFLLSAVQGWFW